MKILVSNDDGYLAPGIDCLASHVSRIAEVTVVAPDRNRSGASNSLTLKNPLRVYQASNGFYYVEGTPTDCVHLAITGLVKPVPDMVIAGINNGANLGDDVLYSGTVAAATEGRFLGLPAIAVSLAGEQVSHFETAARVVTRILKSMELQPLPTNSILNINVPDIEYENLAGWQVTRLGQRHQSEPVVSSKTPSGEQVYWVGPAGKGEDAGPGTDFHAVEHGYVSITPIKVDLTSYSSLDPLKDWLDVIRQNAF